MLNLPTRLARNSRILQHFPPFPHYRQSTAEFLGAVEQVVVFIDHDLVAVLVAYPLSFGPVVMLLDRDMLPESAMEPIGMFYFPLYWVSGTSELTATAYAWYVRFWMRDPVPAPARRRFPLTSRSQVSRRDQSVALLAWHNEQESTRRGPR